MTPLTDQTMQVEWSPLPGHWYDTIDSTQEEAKRLIQAGQIHGTAFVVAAHQTAGKGTQGRRWASPENAGLYLTVIHLPPEGAYFEATALYTKAAGVACMETLQEVAGIRAALKPLNDLYLDNRKLGGILVESTLHQKGITAILTGIGMNIAAVPRLLDRPEVQPIALAEVLSAEELSRFSTERLIETLVAKVCFWYSLVFEGYPGQVERAWEKHCL